MVLIKNAAVLTCADKDFENGYVIIKDKKIADTGVWIILNMMKASLTK